MVILSEEVVGAINAQIEREQFASFVYKTAEAWCDRMGYDGSVKFLHKASGEEVEHRDMFVGYLTSLDAVAQVPFVLPLEPVPGSEGYNDSMLLGEIMAEAKEPTALKGVFQLALTLERFVTKHISQLMVTARESGDEMTAQFMLWFVDEQRKSLADLLTITRWFVAYPNELAQIDERIGEMAG